MTSDREKPIDSRISESAEQAIIPREQGRPAYLMPSALELSSLHDPIAAQVLINCDNANRREANFASLSMMCGTIGLLGCLGIFAYLVRIDHPKSAAVAIGTGVLAIVGQIVNSRLNKKVS